MIETAFLVDHPDAIPTLAQWFRTQWPEYFSGRTLTDIAQDFYSEANRNMLPARLVAFYDGELAGTVTLREHALRTLPEYQPGLGGLFVIERYRSCGIGTELIRTGMQVAWSQGYEKLYTATATANGILERLGWKQVQAVSHGEERLGLFCCERNK